MKATPTKARTAARGAATHNGRTGAGERRWAVSKGKINVALLLRVADQISKTPEAFHMALWECGTSACIAGWACRLADGKPAPETFVRLRACQLLGFYEDWPMLFKETLWPYELRSSDTDTPADRADKAVRRIHAFLDEHAPGWREQAGKLDTPERAQGKEP